VNIIQIYLPVFMMKDSWTPNGYTHTNSPHKARCAGKYWV